MHRGYHLLLTFVLAFAGIIGFCSGARAQETTGAGGAAEPPSSADNLVPVWGETTAWETVIKEEPYRHWKHHVGKAAECVVQVHIAPVDGTPPRTVSGIVIRCDGFILVPRDVARDLDTHARITAVVTGAEGEALTEPLPITVRDHTITPEERVDYISLKTNGHHLKCVRLLSARMLQPGTPIKVVYAEKDQANPALCQATVLTGKVGAAEEDGVHFRLTELMTEERKPVESVSLPPGAAVIDAASEGLLGLVIQAKKGSFASMAHFNEAYNVVGIAPSRATLKRVMQRDKEDEDEITPEASAFAASTPGGMVHIPGSPVRLVGETARHFRREFGTDVACTPGFFVDAYPVTSGEYRKWLIQTRFKVPAPRGWPGSEAMTPTRIPTIPVTGMLPRDAVLYAEDHEKRLPTAAEWLIAARMRDVSWFQSGLEDARKVMEATVRLQKLIKAYEDRQIASLVQVAQVQQRGTSNSANSTPILMIEPSPEIEDAYRLRSAMIAQTLPLWPLGYLAPVGLLAGDVSIYGVHDVLTNIPEFVLPRGQDAYTAEKRFPAVIDPYVSFIQGSSHFLNPSPTGPQDPRQLSAVVAVNRFYIDMNAEEKYAFVETILPYFAGIRGMSSTTGGASTLINPFGRAVGPVRQVFSLYGSQYRWSGMILSGFRCAQ